MTSTCRTIIEHGLLFRASPGSPEAENRIPAADFDALRALLVDADDSDDGSEASGDTDTTTIPYARLLRLRNAGKELALQVRNFVGVLETPSGLQIEILPKVGASPEHARQTLIRMLRASGRIPPIPAHQASLRPVGLPLTDFFASEFLQAVLHLLKRGLLSGYERLQGNDRFLKGRLLVGQHLRHNLVRADRFYVEHDHYRLNRAENRLIRRALEVVSSVSVMMANQKLCRELLFAFDDVPSSSQIAVDFEHCGKDRSLTHYADALMWARLILLRLRPLGSGGQARVRALLFPMERLFDDCVGVGLRKCWQHPVHIRAQAGTQHLVTRNGTSYFQLRPDYLVEQGGHARRVVDAKWKLLVAPSTATDKKYGLSQADLYQLYAYGNKYLSKDSARHVVLVYPRTDAFREPLPSLHYEHDHTLHVVPFDLDRFELIASPELLAI